MGLGTLELELGCVQLQPTARPPNLLKSNPPLTEQSTTAMAFAGDPVVLEITDTSSAAPSGAPSLPRPAPVCVSYLARFDPLPSPTVAVRADRHRQPHLDLNPSCFLSFDDLILSSGA